MLQLRTKRVAFFSLQPKNCNFAKASLGKELECPERESFNKCDRGLNLAPPVFQFRALPLCQQITGLQDNHMFDKNIK